jgi:hypothetical protein
MNVFYASRMPAEESAAPEWQPLLGFLDANPRRRSPSDVSFGQRWTKDGVKLSLAWFPGTGELCLLSSGTTPMNVVEAVTNLFGIGGAVTKDVRVSVIGILTREEVESVLSGWREAMRQPDSFDWLVDRLTQAE